MTRVDLTIVDRVVEQIGRAGESVIPILQALQRQYGFLPPEALERVCRITDITPAAIASVSTFYSQFRHSPVGKHIIGVCHGTACHVKGAPEVHEAILRRLGLSGQDKDTDADGVFTVRKVACLGCCTLAPAIQIDQVTYGHLTPETAGGVLADFLELQRRQPARKASAAKTADADAAEIRVGLGSCCLARGSGAVREAFVRAVAQTGISARIKQVGCVGMCHQTPLVEIVLPGGASFLYARCQPADARAILLRHFKPKGLINRLGQSVSSALEKILTDEAWPPPKRYSINVRDPQVRAFLDRQKHIATEHCGRIDPLDIDEYVAHGGFVALRRCIREMSPEDVIAEMRTAGLRGRGGAGFPTAAKWLDVRSAGGRKKYVICNGDEGDPGAFMDRMILESYPYRVLEGVAIAAYAVGADEGILYIRQEYPLAVRRISEAISRCLERGFLGDGVLGGDFRLKLRIMQGAGAFVCGEETALLASLEGRRGTPRPRPPYPSRSGLQGRPTLVNNTETFAFVPWIIRNGGAALARLGTGKSKGTKVFALAGKVVRGGLVEVPMGITIGQIVELIGGGVAGGKRFKAVQIGGPSGGCVPAALADTPVDYESLVAVGAFMGSGGMVVLDDSDCMVDIARYFLEFTQDQSCGKCTFCRIGTRRMLHILDRLCRGVAKQGDIERLERLAESVRRGSLCGLGRSAPNPVLTTLRYFRHEYEAHLAGRCPAGVCRDLIEYAVTDDCIGCTLCAQRCPAEAIKMNPYRKHEIDSQKCIRCRTCKRTCPADAVVVR